MALDWKSPINSFFARVKQKENSLSALDSSEPTLLFGTLFFKNGNLMVFTQKHVLAIKICRPTAVRVERENVTDWERVDLSSRNWRFSAIPEWP